MAAIAGRDVRVYYRTSTAGTYTLIAGAKTESFTINNEPIDITDKDDAGVRTLLDDIGTKNVDMSVEGVLVTDTYLKLANGAGQGTALHQFKFDGASHGDLEGSWFINSFQAEGTEGTDPTTFTMALQSGGAISFTTG